jgi:hypothetical protein
VSDYTPEQLRRIDGLIEQHVFGRAVEWRDGVPYSPDHSAPMLLPEYTAAGTWAWLVLEWLARNVGTVCIDVGTETWYSVCEKIEVVAITLPLAVCLHALAVAGVDVEKEVAG